MINSNSEKYNQIQLLDMEWNNKLPTYMTRGTLPSESNSISKLLYGFLAITIVGIVLSGALLKMPAIAIVLATAQLILMLVIIKNAEGKRNDYLNAKKSYEEKRQILVSKLEAEN